MPRSAIDDCTAFVARYGAKVELSPAARAQAKDTYGLLLEAAQLLDGDHLLGVQPGPGLPLDDDELGSVLEALLLVVDTPVSVEALAAATQQPVYRIATKLQQMAEEGQSFARMLGEHRHHAFGEIAVDREVRREHLHPVGLADAPHLEVRRPHRDAQPLGLAGTRDDAAIVVRQHHNGRAQQVGAKHPFAAGIEAVAVDQRDGG